MKRAAIYTRISRDPEGTRDGVDRQEEDCRALAAREGLQVIEVYPDNDVSASAFSRKPREQYAALMDDAKAGKFDVILAYSNSRLTRRLRELEDLIALHDQYGIRIKTVVSGEDDLSTADGRMVARIKASVDVAESEKIGERSRRARLDRARRGTVNTGARPFGWRPDKLTLDPKESALILKAVDDVLDGIGLREIARRWNAAGFRTVPGNEWDHRSVRQLLKGPRLAGRRVHRGEVLTDASGEPVRGVWEPLLSDETYDRLQDALRRSHGRSGGRRGARKYLLSGVARCGVCGARMFGTRAKTEGHVYTCRKAGERAHTVSAAGLLLDEDVMAVVEAYLHRADLDAPAPRPFSGEHRLVEIGEKIAELMTAYNSGQLSGAVVFPAVRDLEEERAELGAERQAYIAATNLPRRVSADDFLAADLARQRGVIESVLSAVVISPAERRGAPWTGDRIKYVWRDA